MNESSRSGGFRICTLGVHVHGRVRLQRPMCHARTQSMCHAHVSLCRSKVGTIHLPREAIRLIRALLHLKQRWTHLHVCRNWVLYVHAFGNKLKLISEYKINYYLNFPFNCADIFHLFIIFNIVSRLHDQSYDSAVLYLQKNEMNLYVAG